MCISTVTPISSLDSHFPRIGKSTLSFISHLPTNVSDGGSPWKWQGYFADGVLSSLSVTTARAPPRYSVASQVTISPLKDETISQQEFGVLPLGGIILSGIFSVGSVGDASFVVAMLDVGCVGVGIGNCLVGKVYGVWLGVLR